MIPEELAIIFVIFAFLAVFAFVILLLVFWIWMLIDSIKRDYKNDGEKVAWVLVIIFMQIVGALLYFFIIKVYHPRGLGKN